MKYRICPQCRKRKNAVTEFADPFSDLCLECLEERAGDNADCEETELTLP